MAKKRKSLWLSLLSRLIYFGGYFLVIIAFFAPFSKGCRFELLATPVHETTIRSLLVMLGIGLIVTGHLTSQRRVLGLFLLSFGCLLALVQDSATLITQWSLSFQILFPLTVDIAITVVLWHHRGEFRATDEWDEKLLKVFEVAPNQDALPQTVVPIRGKF